MHPFFNAIRRRPLVIALLCQVLAGIVVQGLGTLAFSTLGLKISFFLFLFSQGSLAAFFGYLVKLPYWWVPLNLLLPPLAGLALTLGLPTWVYLTGFLILLLVFWNSVGERVPLYLSNKTTWQQVYNLLPKGHAVKVVDLGCGFAGLLNFLSKARPESHFVGVESAPLPFLISSLRLLGRKNATVKYQSLWDEDLSQYDVIYCFLSPAPMPEIFHKAIAEMRSGSLLISNSFEVPDYPADRILTLTDRRETKLHLWHFGRPD